MLENTLEKIFIPIWVREVQPQTTFLFATFFRLIIRSWSLKTLNKIFQAIFGVKLWK